MERPVQKIEISHRTVVFTVFFLIGLYLLSRLMNIVVLLFVSVIFMSALNPTVDRLERLKIPRTISILLIYLLVIGLFSTMIAGIIPPLVDQTSTLISRIPEYLELLNIPNIDPNLLNSQISQFGSIPGNLLKLTVSIFSNLASVLVCSMITFYLLLERKKLDDHLVALFGIDTISEKRARDFVDKLEIKIGGWIRAQVTLMIIIGVMVYIGLRLLGIEYALPLAILAGFLEVVPNVGPLLSAAPAVLTGLTISPITGLAVAALYFLIQQLENTLIVPQVMAKEAGVNPLVTIVSLLVGFQLAGVMGAVLAIPFYLLFRIALSELKDLRNP